MPSVSVEPSPLSLSAHCSSSSTLEIDAMPSPKPPLFGFKSRGHLHPKPMRSQVADLSAQRKRSVSPSSRDIATLRGTLHPALSRT
jgi:hypothetical protein